MKLFLAFILIVFSRQSHLGRNQNLGPTQLQSKNLSTAEGKSTKIPYSQMSLTAKYIGTAVSDPNWYNWCVSPVEGSDGKIHIFGSRWPAKDGMKGWTGPNAEIAHFIADKPEGPFRYVGTVLKTSMFPDPSRMAASHNPRLEKVDNKYILLFIAQNPSIGIKGQRIVMMVARNLNGPWRFAGKENGIMLVPSSDPNHWTYAARTGLSNPAFLKIGRKYYIYFKCRIPGQAIARYGYAVSDNLEGPYVLSSKPITDNVSFIEDAQAFSWNKKYYFLTTDNVGGNTGIGGDIILWRSKSGVDFKLADAEIAMGNILDYWGSEEDHKQLRAKTGYFQMDPSGKLERPVVLFIDGKPAYFYAPADINIHGGKVSESYIFKIDWAKGQPQR